MGDEVKLLFLDFETYYEKYDYTLRKLSIPEYVFDGRFEATMLGYGTETGEVKAIHPKEIPDLLKEFPPEQTGTITYNALFDNAILAWRYGYVPHRIIDAMGMARALHGHKLRRFSLGHIADYLKTRTRKGDAIEEMAGMHANVMWAHPRLPSFKHYCVNDVEMTRDAFFQMLPHFPPSEFKIMDLVLRCAIEPQFQVDRQSITDHIARVRARREEVVRASGADAVTLRSTLKFAALLNERGIAVEMKPSAATGDQIPALAKTDAFMATLLEHDDETIRALAAARLGVRSTLEETRAVRFSTIAGCPWGSVAKKPLPAGNGLLPVPLRYCAAHTWRLGGDWKINLQNLPSGRGTTKGTQLRNQLLAGPGNLVVKCDLSQIEARITAWICGQLDLLKTFETGGDPYSDLGCEIFGIDRDELKRRGGKESLERFIGKSGILGLGFQCGPPKFHAMVLRSARGMGMDITPLLAIWTEELAKKSVSTYRRKFSHIPGTWALLESILTTAWWGTNAPVNFGPVEIGHGYVKGPHGATMRYVPKRHETTGELGYTFGEEWTNIYGGKFLENIVQFVARLLIMHAALRMANKGYNFALQEHDALAYVVPEGGEAYLCARLLLDEVRRRPSWGLDLPVDAELGIGISYGETVKWKP